MRGRIGFGVFCIWGLAACLLPVLAWAYIPPSAFLIKSLVAKHGAYRSFRVRGQLAATGEPSSSGPRLHFTSIVSQTSGTVKSWITDDSDQLLYSTERKLAGSVPSALLFETNAHTLAELLRSKRIPVRSEVELQELDNEDARRAAEMESLTRWQGSVAYVIGSPLNNSSSAPAKATPEPALYVEKDSFLPLRALYPLAGLDGGWAEVRFQNYRSYRDFPFPRLLSFGKRGEAPLLQAEVSEVIPNPEAGLLKLPGGADFRGFTDAGNAASSSQRELIEQYYEFFH